MKELYQHIESFDEEWTPSPSMLESYFSGKLNATDLKKVEHWISLSEFGDEIGDLYQSDTLDKVDWNYLKEKSTLNSSSINQWVAYILSTLGLICFLIISNINTPKHTVNLVEEYILEEIKPKQAIEIAAIKQTLSEFSSTTITLDDIEKMKIGNESETRERLERKIITIPRLINPKLRFIPKKINEGSNHPVKYILKFKVVDYFQEYLKEKETLRGLQSEYSSVQEQDLLNKNIKQVKVDDVLQAGLEAFYKRDYYLAIHHFDKILSHYPEDLNALFYSALSCYKLKDYTRTISKLQLVAENDINVFLQEAEWYLAKSHYKKGELNQSNNLLDIIIESDGFYKDKAIEMRKNTKSIY